MKNEPWLLPEGIEELLPAQALRLETLRRDLLDLLASWGYELVIPPFIDYLESLLTGTGRDLDLKTFKLTDQLSGRQLGIRADMTPQVARIDSHRLRREVPTRLCYLGTVLHTHAGGFGGTRSPMQVGAELYGHGGVESDVEILLLTLATLERAGVSDIFLDLGHVHIFRGLARQAGLNDGQEMALFDALQRKAIPEVRALVETLALPDPVAAMLCKLSELNGAEEVIPAAREALKEASDEVLEALDYLFQVAEAFKARRPDVPLHYDLAELRAYQYQTGIVFAAFVMGEGTEIARGGRYDDIGRAFGRARPATGFSADLRTLLRLADSGPVTGAGTILAPWEADPGLAQLVEALRSGGESVIWALPGPHGDAAAMGCRRRIFRDGEGWAVEDVTTPA